MDHGSEDMKDYLGDYYEFVEIQKRGNYKYKDLDFNHPVFLMLYQTFKIQEAIEELIRVTK